MYEGVTSCSSVLAQPWISCPSDSISSSPVMSEGNYTTMTIKHEDSDQSFRAMGSFQSEFNGSTLDTHQSLNEEFFIGDLSEFSNEDIAAPIHSGNYSSHQSDDNHSASTIKSDCTTYTAHTNSSASALLEDSIALDCKTISTAVQSHELKDSSISLPCQDETGFEWLASLGDENLIYGASNVGIDSFLLNDSEPFGDYSGIMKHSEYEDAIKAKDMSNMGHISITGTQAYEQDGPDQDKIWHDDMNGLKDCNDATIFAPHATGSRSARTKRARSSGWSSTSSILCNNWSESTSPTNSLNSTSQIMMPTPQYSGTPSFICNQEEGYTMTSHRSTEANISSRLMSNQNSDNSLYDMNNGTKFGSTSEQWPKEEFDNSREESVGNYGTGGGLQPRRCTHCQSQKTPQWRAGPQGPKTLCNACGVRYKSGRLFDEYRPAKSPSFLSYKHSNSHKKVMEMRRRKTFQYNPQQQHVMHPTRTPAPRKHADNVDQKFISKLKFKLSNPANSEPCSFSDVTLISTRNAIDSPSSFLY